MSSVAASGQTFSQPRGPSAIDLTLSSDDESPRSKQPKSSRPRPRVLDSDSEDDDSDLEIVQPTKPHRRVIASDSEEDQEEEVSASRGTVPVAPKAAVHSAARHRRDESDSTESEQEEEEGDELEASDDEPQVESRPRPIAATTMADAIAAMSFRKKASPAPVAQAAVTSTLDSAQKAALRNQGFLPPSPKPTSKKADTRGGQVPLFYSNPKPTFLKPKGSSHFQSKNEQVQAGSSSFAFSSGAFNLKAKPIGIKQRIATQVDEENKAKGIAIAIPKNPPPSVIRAEGKVGSSKKAESDDAADDALAAFSNLEIDDVTELRQKLAVQNVVIDENNLDDDPPPHLVCKLLPHQVDSLRWLKKRESGKGSRHGGLLGDDMGLGKTIQMLALILSNAFDPDGDIDTIKTTLIVAPAGLLNQWKNEIESKTNKKLRAITYHGTPKQRETMAQTIHRYDVAVTSYETLLSDCKNESGVFARRRRPFYRVILDEAHNIKNPNAQKSKACVAVRAHYRWALTGTPIQNSVNDLFSIFQFLGKRVVPRGLHEKNNFDEYIVNHIKSKRSQLGFEHLSAVLAEIMKRRTKTTTVNGKPILPLPARIVTVVRSQFLDKEEQEFYDAIQEKLVLQMNKFLKGGNMAYAQVLVRLLRLRQATLHPALVTKASIALDAEAIEDQGGNDTDTKFTKNVAQMAICTACGEELESAGNEFCGRCEKTHSQYVGLQSSTKIKKIMELLEQIREESTSRDDNGKRIPKKKTIIFSQFTSMLDLLETFLEAGGYRFVRFDGSCSIAAKNAAIEKITDDPKTTVILISLKAGAVGLNLTMCSRVILVDLWWNPAIEAQAFDRAHRYGQKEDVKIFKLVIDGTVEDRILTLQEQKAHLAAAALDGADLSNAKLSDEDRNFLFGMPSKAARRKQ